MKIVMCGRLKKGGLRRSAGMMRDDHVASFEKHRPGGLFYARFEKHRPGEFYD